MNHARLSLEFAPAARRHSPGSLLVLLVALLVFGAVAAKVTLGLRANAQQRDALAQLASQGRPVAAKSRSPARPDAAEAARAQWVRQTASSLATPWADLFAVLEDAPDNVALLVVEPSAARRSVALTAEAAGPVDMLNYLTVLQNDVRLTDVMLVSHAVQPQLPGSPLRFQLRASWGRAQP